MTLPQFLRAAAAEWEQVHTAVHGEMDRQTAETVYEALGFLISCAQTAPHTLLECPCDVPGTPYQADLLDEDAHV